MARRSVRAIHVTPDRFAEGWGGYPLRVQTRDRVVSVSDRLSSGPSLKLALLYEKMRPAFSPRRSPKLAALGAQNGPSGPF
jgi:hypothetical protein